MPRRPASETASSVEPQALPEELVREFGELGLTPYEARILLALLRLGTASTLQLARTSQVPRSNVYTQLELLRTKGLAERIASNGPATWTTLPRDEVLAQLDALQAERLQRHRERSKRVEGLLEQAFASGQDRTLPFMRVIHDRAQALRSYEQMLDSARSEVLIFNRPPYSAHDRGPIPAVIAMLRRGVPTRALYQAAEVDHTEAEAWHTEMAAYQSAGVEGRVAPALPGKLVIVDRRYSLLSLDDPNVPNIGFPTVLYIDHPQYAEMQTAAFEHYWTNAASNLTVAPVPTPHLEIRHRPHKPPAR